MKNFFSFFLSGILLFPVISSVQAQSPVNLARQLENIVRQEGEVYLAVERYEATKEKNCRIEDVFSNNLIISSDSLTLPYTNHTEPFCEAFVLHSQFVFQIALHDIDPAAIILAQRNYNHGMAKLLEGQASWFEVQLTAREKKPLIRRRDVVNRESDTQSSLRIIFKTKEGATKGLALLRQLVQENAAK